MITPETFINGLVVAAGHTGCTYRGKNVADAAVVLLSFKKKNTVHIKERQVNCSWLGCFGTQRMEAE